MSVKEKTKHIIAELKGHAPFTLFGALLGIVFMFFFLSLRIGGNSLCQSPKFLCHIMV